MKIFEVIKDVFFAINQKKKCIVMKPGCRVHHDCVIEGNNYIGKRTKLFNVTMGRGSYIANNSRLENCTVGRFCSIGSNVNNVVGQHPTKGFITTSPAFYSNRFACIGFSGPQHICFNEHKYSDDDKHYVNVGNDVWIGNNVLIMEGIKIGDGAIIAAGAVITKNVPPFAIVGGVPAKIIKYRFNEKEVEFILGDKWWDKSVDDLNIHADAFSDLETYKKVFGIK